MTNVFKVYSIIAIFMALGIATIFAEEGALSPMMAKWEKEQEKILADATLTPREQVASWVKSARECHDDEVMAKALWEAIFILSVKENGKENREDILPYYKELMAIQSDKPFVLKCQKELLGLPGQIAAYEKNFQEKVDAILKNDDGFAQCESIMRSRQELAKEKQLLPCIEAIKDPSLRGKVAFAIYEDLVSYKGLSTNETDAMKEALKPFIVAAGELGAKYFEAKELDNVNAALLDAIRNEIWGADVILRGGPYRAIARFADGLSKKEGFWPPLLSSVDKTAYESHVTQAKDSCHLVDKAVAYIAQSKDVFYRKGREYNGARLALHLEAKLPLLRKHPSFSEMPLEQLRVLMQTTSSTILGKVNNNVPVDQYQVKTDEGELVNVFPWILKKLNLSESEKKLVEASKYADVLK